MSQKKRVVEDASASDLYPVSSIDGHRFQLPKAIRDFMCLMSDGTLYVSETHKNELAVMSFIGRLTSMNMDFRPEYVGLAEIKRLYDLSKPTANAGGSVTQEYAINLFRLAVKLDATDIHIHVTKSFGTKILMRILGDLETIEVHPFEYGMSLCATLYQALTDQSDAVYTPNIGQDARISSSDKLPKEISGIRVATRPLVSGTFMALRLFPKQMGKLNVNLVPSGFLSEQTKTFQALRNRPTGIIFISGPTGAGKSTTLMKVLAAMAEECEGKKNILSVEDPVELEIPGVVQTPVVNAQTEEERALAMQRAIKEALRLDPDAIMIGEVRDKPSLILAINAAMTGHLVFASIHANDAFGIFDRIRDMGLPIDQVADKSIVAGITAQRLVKRLCDHCKVPLVTLGEEGREVYYLVAKRYGNDSLKTVMRRGPGCQECKGKGYAGRTAIAEVFESSSEMMNLIKKGDREGALRSCVERGQYTMEMHAIQKVRDGMIDPVDIEHEIAWSEEKHTKNFRDM